MEPDAPLRTLDDLGPGAHLCCLSRSEEEHRQALTAFLARGLERGERVVCLAEPSTAEIIRGFLRDAGRDPDALLARGQLIFHTREEVFSPKGVFDPAGLVGLLETETGRALADGFPALRATAEMGWVLRRMANPQALLELNARLTAFLPNSRCLFLCQFDQRRSELALLLDVLRMQPVLLLGARFCENVYYVSPDELAGASPPEVELAHRLRTLERHTQAVEALRESEEKYRQLFEMESDALFLIENETGQILEVNPAAPALYGYSREELLRLKNTDVSAEPQATHEATRQHRPRVPIRFHRKKDGTVFPVEITARHFSWRGREVHVAAIRDITERQQAQEERRALEARFQQAQRLESLGILAGGIAHDFNNLLTGILGHADLARLMLRPNSPAREALEQVVTAARRAAGLTQQLLAYAGRGQVEVRPVQLGELVAEMGELLAVSVPKHCRLRTACDQELPAIEADPAQLRQVIMNLILNGAEALGEQGGTVSVGAGVRECTRADLADTHTTEKLPPGCYVALEVSDTGCGMTEETRIRIFEPFFTTKFAGRGLGMAAVLGIVRGHRGGIQVNSAPGRGTTVRVLFPASDRQAERMEAAQAKTSGWRGQGTILVVDDEAALRSLAEAILETAGFTVLTAADGREGVETFRAHADRIRAVLLDLTMPNLDGIQAFQELRRIRPEVPVILCSGYAAEEAASRFQDQRPAGFLQKPYTVQELLGAVRAALERQDSAGR